jgi:hypothetical protein
VEVPSFLAAARSDIVGILYAGAVGFERSAYLHARSLLENLVRHCYFDSRPALFVARHLEREDDVQDKWADLFGEIQGLPCFVPARKTVEVGADQDGILDGSALFAELKHAYRRSSRFIHGSTVRYRSAYEGVGSIELDSERTQELGAFLRSVGEVGLLLLTMAHIGPYLLISQPIRRFMLLTMRPEARARFLRCVQRISLPWAQHHRAAALRTLRARAHEAVPSPHGLLHKSDGTVLIASPSR